MFTLKCIEPAYFDVDDTLIMWNPSPDDREEDGTDCNWSIKTLALDEQGRATIKEKLEEDAFVPHRAHVEQLKNHKRRGHTVIVWSAGGWRWAEQAVRLLGLEDYVDLVVDKPRFLYDDKEVTEFMPRRQYIPLEHEEDDGESPKKEARADNGPYGTIAGEATSPFRESRPAGRR